MIMRNCLRRTLLVAVLFGPLWCSNVTAAEPLIVGTRVAAPFVMPDPDDPDAWTGLSIELWTHLAQQLDVDYEIREFTLPDLLTGVERGEIDVAVAALTATAERERSVDFTHPYFQSSLGVAVAAQPASGGLAALGALFSAEFLQAVGEIGRAHV